MTRKHYEKMAEAFRAYHLQTVTELGEGTASANVRLDVLEDVTDILSEIFKGDNPRFDSARFKSACIPAELKG